MPRYSSSEACECGQAQDDRDVGRGMIANVPSMFEYSFVTVSFLCYCALQNCHGAALPGSIATHASSGQFLGSLLSDKSAQLIHTSVANGTILLLFNFDNRRSLDRD